MALPCELLDEILFRLRVKDLLRCRCVSKGWCSLIDSTAFVKKHLKRTIECDADGGVIIQGEGKFYLADFECLAGEDDVAAIQLNDPLISGAKFVGAANGFVCLSNDEMSETLFFNPSTRKVRKLPTIPPEFPHLFHPFQTSLCGFGYDHVNDDFKVVRIANWYPQSRATMVIVYSMNTDSWTQIEDVPSISSSETWGIFASGAVHWLATNNPDDLCDIILAFDLGIEQFREVPFPVVDGASVSYNKKRLFNVGGSLCIVNNYFSPMDLYLMNSYGAETSWQKAFSVEQPLLGALRPFEFFRPITFSKIGNIVLLELHCANCSNLVWYDIEKKKVKKIVNIHGITSEFDSHLYTEILLPLTKDKHLKKLSPKPSLVMKEKNQRQKRDDFFPEDSTGGYNLDEENMNAWGMH